MRFRKALDSDSRSAGVFADSHGATLRFEARPEGGVRATVEIDAAGPAGEDTEGRKTMKVNEQGEDA